MSSQKKGREPHSAAPAAVVVHVSVNQSSSLERRRCLDQPLSPRDAMASLPARAKRPDHRRIFCRSVGRVRGDLVFPEQVPPGVFMIYRITVGVVVGALHGRCSMSVRPPCRVTVAA